MASGRGDENDKDSSGEGVDSNKRIEKECRFCKKLFSLPRCRDYRDHYCSRACGNKHREAIKQSRKAKCPNCEKEFIARNAQLRDGNKPYCSISCITKGKKQKEDHKRKRLESYMRGNHLHPSGADVHNWKGGIALTTQGYYKYSAGENAGRNVHTVLIEQKIGRRITNQEVVHHINHVKTDNRIENLRLMTRAEHMRHHLHES